MPPSRLFVIVRSLKIKFFKSGFVQSHSCGNKPQNASDFASQNMHDPRIKVVDMSIAVFAGSFDPFTIGHLDIVRRAAPHFEKIYIAIFKNPGKQNERFTPDERICQISDAVQELKNVYVTEFSGLVVDFCRSVGADCLVRGIRSGSDVDYERKLEQVNRKLAPEIETMFLLSRPEFAHISSSLVRQLMDINISIDGLVPDAEHIVFTRRRNSYGK